MWENTPVAKNIPDDVEIKIQVIVAGATLDDASMSRIITNQELDEIGEYPFNLIYTKTVSGSTCHTIKMYQTDADGQKTFLGEAYYSGNLVPDDE